MELQLSWPIEFKVSYFIFFDEKNILDILFSSPGVIHEREKENDDREWSGFIFQLQRKMQQVKNFGNKKRNSDF